MRKKIAVFVHRADVELGDAIGMLEHSLGWSHKVR
jgi:hypothetical protein